MVFMPIAPLITPYDTNDDELYALCLWREARGESYDAKYAVAHVIQNRMSMAPRQGFSRTVRGNILKPWAFSSFMSGDANATKYPAASDRSWADCQRAVRDAKASANDITLGAVFYYSEPVEAPPRAWGSVVQTVRIGGLAFCAISG